MFRVKVLVSVLVIILTSVLTSQVALGSAAGSPEMVVLLVDRDSVGRTSGGANLVKSLVGLSSVLRGDHYFMYASTDESDAMLGPVRPKDQEFSTFTSQIDLELNSPPVSGHWSLADALADVYNRLADEGAAPGSAIYLVTGGQSQIDLSELAGAPGPIVSLLADYTWPIVGLSLPGSSDEVIGDLRELSLYTGGKSFELSVPSGLAALADDVLTEDAKGSLDMITQGASDRGRVLTSLVPIAPGTSEATLLFFRQATHGSVRLSNPSGSQASTGDRTSSTMLETPHVVIWRLLDPAPGNWKVDVQGLRSVVSVWQSTLNRYSLVLEQVGPVPLGRPVTIIASVRDNGQKANLEGDVRVRATIESPEGGAVTYDLNDQGERGDSAAGDGFYSETISAIAQAGEYQVQLELRWPEYDHRVTSEATFASQTFPSIELTTLETDGLRPGERAAVAEVSVYVDGQPYAVPVDDLASSLTANVSQKGTIEVKPRQLTSSNAAWMYDVFFTPAEAGRHTLIFHLDTGYAGRQYRLSTGSFVVSSSVPSSPPSTEPVVEEGADAPSVPAAVPPVASRQDRSEEPVSLPWILVGVPTVVVLLIVTVGVVWRLSMPRPYGFLYDDQDNLVVDFSAIKQGPLMRMLSGDRIPGKDIAVRGLEGVSFRFWSDRVGIRSFQDTPTVRVNSQPLLGEAVVEERAWIGTRGRLYSFLTSPPHAAPDPAPPSD